MCVCVCVWTCACVHTSVCVHIYKYSVHVCMHVCELFVCLCVCVCVCVCDCMRVSLHVINLGTVQLRKQQIILWYGNFKNTFKPKLGFVYLILYSTTQLISFHISWRLCLLVFLSLFSTVTKISSRHPTNWHPPSQSWIEWCLCFNVPQSRTYLQSFQHLWHSSF